jgi:hypothetical protein
LRDNHIVLFLLTLLLKAARLLLLKSTLGLIIQSCGAPGGLGLGLGIERPGQGRNSGDGC